MSIINATPLLAAAGGDYQISRSVRLRSSASAYFNRTPASAGNRKTWTWSGWVKRGGLTTYTKGKLFGAGTTGGTNTAMVFGFGDSDGDGDWLLFQDVQWATSNNAVIRSSALYRDASAWYHIVLAVDTTQATGTDRVKIFVNGLQISTTFVVTPSLNVDMRCNTASMSHYVGSSPGASVQNYFDGYLTEINFIDGQALTPSSFGETDSITGVWKPKKYAGTYGTNGFYLNFSDNSAATAAAIGKDYSGNGNNWTPNNISVTAGATYDSMLDVPTLYTDGGNGRGNYCTLNAVIPQNQYKYNGTGTTGVLKNGNLDVVGPSGNWSSFIGTIFVSSGKWYWEVTDIAEPTANYCLVGTHSITESATPYFANANNFAPSDVLGFALDMDAGTFVWYKNNVLQATLATGLTGQYAPWCDVANSNEIAFNFGQRPFSYTPPTGFKALNTQNLPEPTIKKGNQYFNTVLYTGNATARSITGVGFQPDFVWTKSRSGAESHRLYDAVRGTTQSLYSNLTNAETTEAQSLTAFGSDGFSLGTGAPNSNAVTYAAWNWKESPSAGFDIVTYTGTGATRTVSHSLGVKPSMMIVKNRSSGTTGWAAYHSALGATKVLELNTTSAAVTASGEWNNTEPTSSVFTVGTSSWTNNNTNSIVAYLFAEVPGFSRFGSYTGNGSADGPFVFTGFRPRWVMIKRTDSTGNWQIIDTTRSAYNESVATLYPNLTNAEDLTNTKLDALANGYKIRGTPSTDFNTSGSTYIYAAFAESPFKNSLAR